METKFENEIRPNERYFTKDELEKYKIRDYQTDPIYIFEPNYNLVTLNDKIEYTLKVDKKNITKKTSLLIRVKYKNNDFWFDRRGKGFFDKIDNNKFIITAKFEKKGLYEIQISIGEDSFYRIKNFYVLCKHDFNKENSLEKSKYLGGEGFKEEEIKALKENGSIKINNILNKAPKRVESTLEKFTNYLIKNSKNLNDLEKAYLLYKWIASNIQYDYENYKKNILITEKNEVFRAGKAVCSGYARLFRHFADKINLITENIEGYAKVISYSKQLDMKLS